MTRGLFEQDVVGMHGNADFRVQVRKRTLDQLHRSGRHDRRRIVIAAVPDRLARPLHFRQPPSVRPHRRDLVAREFQQHATQRVAAAFRIRGKQRAANQFLQQTRRKPRGSSPRRTTPLPETRPDSARAA